MLLPFWYVSAWNFCLLLSHLKDVFSCLQTENILHDGQQWSIPWLEKYSRSSRTVLWLTEHVTQWSICLNIQQLLYHCQWPPNSADLNPINYEIRSEACCRDECTIPRSTVSTTISRRTESLNKLFDSGVFDCVRVFVKTTVTLSTRCSLVNNCPILDTLVLVLWYKCEPFICHKLCKADCWNLHHMSIKL